MEERLSFPLWHKQEISREEMLVCQCTEFLLFIWQIPCLPALPLGWAKREQESRTYSSMFPFSLKSQDRQTNRQNSSMLGKGWDRVGEGQKYGDLSVSHRNDI